MTPTVRITNAAISKQVEDLNTKVDLLLDLLLGDAKTPDKPGLLEKIRLVEKWQSGEKWVLLLLAALFLADLGSMILSFWKGK